jgi:molybdate transport system substrate-binding protein
MFSIAWVSSKRSKPVDPERSGGDHFNAEIVACDEAELGIQLISEIVFVPGAELLGPLPAELQATNAISAGIVTTASEPDAAMMLFKFLTSAAAAAVIKATRMEPGRS